MDFLTKLLSAAAGYGTAKEQADAQVAVAKLSAETAAAAKAEKATTQAAAAQIIPGVSNTTVFAIGAGILALGLVVVIASRK